MSTAHDATPPPRLPHAAIDRFANSTARFLHIESASGVVLLLATAAAVLLANSPAANTFLAFWKTPVGLSIGQFTIQHSLQHWINDGLMVIFFFLIGLELKREIVHGELRDPRAAALPIAAAFGGMLAPAAIYLALQSGTPGQHGWGIPMATDIAFVVGCLALLGPRVPRSLRVLLLTLAIADDVGAILVIAFGYTSGLHLAALGWGLAGLALVVILQRLGVRSIPVYLALGIGIWFGFHESGVHATIAGVILGLLTPAHPWVSNRLLTRFVDRVSELLTGDDTDDDQLATIHSLRTAARESRSPAERLESMLHPWVMFVIVPLFALANAGVPLARHAFTDPIAIAVALGLVVGKPLGVLLLSGLAVATRIATLPPGVTWRVLGAGGVLAGIGFTMSLFIAGLALETPHLDAAKVGILLGSAVAALIGLALLRLLLPPPNDTV